MIAQIAFLIIILYFSSIFVFTIISNLLMYKKINATITNCKYEKGNLSATSFTFNYKNKLYGPYDDKNLGLLQTCQIGDSYPIKINPLFPSQFTTGSFDVIGLMILSIMFLMIAGLYIFYRYFFKIENHWFFN